MRGLLTRGPVTLMIQYRKLDEIKNDAEALSKRSFFMRCIHSSRDAEKLKDLQQEVSNIKEYFRVCIILLRIPSYAR